MKIKVPCTYQIIGNKVILTPNTPLKEGKTYEVVSTTLIKDTFGQAFPSQTITDFTILDFEKLNNAISYDFFIGKLDNLNYNLQYSFSDGLTETTPFNLEYSIAEGNEEPFECVLGYDMEELVVLSSFPLNGSSGILNTENLELNFSSSINNTTVIENSTIFLIEDPLGSPINVAWVKNVTNEKVLIEPTLNLSPSTYYEIQITTNVEGNRGNTLSGTNVINFTTGS